MRQDNPIYKTLSIPTTDFWECLAIVLMTFKNLIDRKTTKESLGLTGENCRILEGDKSTLSWCKKCAPEATFLNLLHPHPLMKLFERSLKDLAAVNHDYGRD